MNARSLRAAALVCAVRVSRGGETRSPITWQGKRFSSSEVPDKLGVSARAAISAWEEWAKKAHYRMDFDAQGRLLLITPRENAAYEDQLKLVAKTETWFDTLLPALPSAPNKETATAPAPTKSKPEAPDAIPEDPESPPVGAPPTLPFKKVASKPAQTRAPEPTTTSWGSGSVEPDTQTAVMLALQDEKDYASVTEFLGATHSALEGWAKTATKQLGFVIEMPLCGAFVLNAAGNDEWNPDHELINRVAQLMILRRFGQQPFWLAQGLAWEAEMAHDQMIYCFPYRSEFVYTAEHGAWPNDLKNQFKERAGNPLKLEEFASWKRGTYATEPAHMAWGFVHFMATLSPVKLSPLLDDLRQRRDSDDRIMKKDGTWERTPGYEVPIERQLEIFKKYLGLGVLTDAAAWFRKMDAPAAKKDKKSDKSINK